MAEINPERLLHDLRELASFGKVGTGVRRLAFSEEDIAARKWLRGRMQEAGLATKLDGVANVYGRMNECTKAVLIGSHTDTVPTGGWLDGSLGVIYGLEIARTWRETRLNDHLGVDVIAFEDEEGSYLSCLGSRSFCGQVSGDEMAQAKSQSGRLLVEAIASADLSGTTITSLENSRYLAYLEAHIEQGPRLEAERRRIGVVTAIVGIRRYQITFNGQADHAGTTPMALRKDAGAAAIRFADQLLVRFEQEAGPHTVWNIGNVLFAPGAANVVPSSAELSLEFRDTSAAILDILDNLLKNATAAANGRGNVLCALRQTLATQPVDMDSSLGERIELAAQQHGVPPLWLPSGAGHDAMILARHLPTAMLFIPSIGGRSHDFSENTAEADIVLGANVLLSMIEQVARAV